MRLELPSGLWAASRTSELIVGVVRGGSVWFLSRMARHRLGVENIDLYKRGRFVLEAKQGSEQVAPKDEFQLSEKPKKTKKSTAVRGTEPEAATHLGQAAIARPEPSECEGHSRTGGQTRAAGEVARSHELRQGGNVR